MKNIPFEEAVGDICRRDSRYDPDVYYFLREALDFSVAMLKKPREGPGRHMTATELLEGIRTFALKEFGPMTMTLFDSWGVKSTLDFGEIVFNLVESGALGKTDEDKKEDFADGYDFHATFVKPFLPRSAQAKEHAAAPPGNRGRKRKKDNRGVK